MARSHRHLWCCLLLALPAAVLADEPAAVESDASNKSEAHSAPVRITAPTVLVTAELREQPAQSVPQSLTAISGQAVKDAGIRSIKEASYLAPNFTLIEFSARGQSFPFARGVGSGQGSPGVATYIDGVPQFTVGSSNVDLLDVERIEFLRGPQGTLYGRNTIAGAITIITRKPDNDWRIGLDAGVGNFTQQDYRLLVSGPVVEDKLFVGLAGSFSSRDGFTKNTVTGHDLDDREAWFGRGQLRATPTEELELVLTVYGERSRDGGFVLSDLTSLRAMPHRVAYDFEGHTHRDLIGPSLTAIWRGEKVELTAITAFVWWDGSSATDFDFTAADLLRRFSQDTQRQFTQEFRVASAENKPAVLGDHAKLAWLLGVLVFHSEQQQQAATEFRPLAELFGLVPMAGISHSTADLTDVGVGIFGQATLTLHEDLDLTVGLRYDYEHKEADLTSAFESGGMVFPTGAQRFRRDFDDFVPRFALAYRWSDVLMTYGSIAKGFKAGGFNQSAPAGRIPFEPETSWTYEVGIKSAWLDERLIVNAALFWIEWDDLQMSLLDPMTGGFYIDNVGRARSRGFEIEAVARLTEHVDLFAGLGFADTRLKRGQDPLTGDASGNRLPFAPRYTWNAGAQATLPLNRNVQWVVRGEAVGYGRYFYNFGNTAAQESFVITNFRLGVRGVTREASWRIEGWIRNAFNQDYIPVAFQYPLAPSGFVGESGAPRTYGVTVSVDF